MITKNRRLARITIGDSKKSFEAKYGNTINKRELDVIACRIAGLLASRNAILGSFSAITITFDNTAPSGVGRIVNYEKWLKYVRYALPSALILESTDIEKLFIEAIFSTLRTLTEADTELIKIDDCEKLVLLHRTNLRFLYRSEESRQYAVKVLVSLLEPYPEFRQVYLQVKDKKTSQEATKLIAELNEMELDHLVAKIRIAKGKIIIGPRKALVTDDMARRYKARGFDYPIEIDIEELLGGAK